MYYYKLKPHIKSLDDLTEPAHADMTYMLHPAFYTIRDYSIRSDSEVVSINDWLVAYRDLQEISRPAYHYISYSTEQEDSVLIDLQDIVGTRSDAAYKDTLMKDLIVPVSTTEEVEQDTTVWSEPRTFRANFMDDYLREQIRARYAFVERPRDGARNIVVDSFLPRLLYKYGMGSQIDYNALRADLPSTAMAISPFTASLLNVPQIPVLELIGVLGYNRLSIMKLIKAVRQRNLHFVFVGAGGTNINTAHWLVELCKLCNIPNLFKEVSVYENDTAEFSNLLRFPKDPNQVLGNSLAKISIIYDDLLKLSSKPSISSNNYYIPNNNGDYPTSIYNYEWQPSYTDGNEKYHPSCRVTTGLYDPDTTVLYGAPTIESRDAISKFGNFLCATHADSSCSIHLNPEHGVALNMQRESYGMIQLGTFFMNQLQMAISLLEILSDSSIDLQEKNKSLLEYSFNGQTIGKTTYKYNWQIPEEISMLTEEQSVDF